MLMELDLFSLEKSWLQGDVSVALQYLKGAYKQEGNQLYTCLIAVGHFNGKSRKLI